MRVLNLVTSQNSRFYAQQIQILNECGVESTTVSVPGHRTHTDTQSSSRSIIDYVRFYPKVLASRDQHDIVHANYGLTAPAAIAQPTRPVVISLWGSDLMGKYQRISQWCARRANAVIVMSEEMGSLLDTDYHVIPHGVDLQLFQPQPQREAQNQVGFNQDKFHVLFPYPAQRRVKNFPRAKRVVEEAKQEVRDDVELHTLHSVPHERMPDYMNASDVLLLTSNREGSPNSVKEALACNLPVVSTDVGDVSERLENLELSFVCQTDDQLIEALVTVCNADRRSEGRKKAQEVSLEQMGREIKDVYESIL